MFKCYAITLCTVFITQQKISTPLSAKRYLCEICAFLNSLCYLDSFWFCVFACVQCVCVCVCVCACGVYVCVYVCMYVCMHACMHACVCVCVFLLYFVFLVLFNQLPYLKFHNKIFTTNWSQIWAFFEDLLKYILSFKNCNTIWKKKEKITKKKKSYLKQENWYIWQMKIGNDHFSPYVFSLFLHW